MPRAAALPGSEQSAYFEPVLKATSDALDLHAFLGCVAGELLALDEFEGL